MTHNQLGQVTGTRYRVSPDASTAAHAQGVTGRDYTYSFEYFVYKPALIFSKMRYFKVPNRVFGLLRFDPGLHEK
jgi:hypothetical protein